MVPHLMHLSESTTNSMEPVSSTAWSFWWPTVMLP
jgi:hypothetical protein